MKYAYAITITLVSFACVIIIVIVVIIIVVVADDVVVVSVILIIVFNCYDKMVVVLVYGYLLVAVSDKEIFF